MIYIILALPLFILGYLVKYKQLSFLIAGYNTSSKEEKSKYDTVALCKAVGTLMFILGGIVLIASLGQFLTAVWIFRISWILFILVAIAALIYMNTGNRFKKP